MTNAPPKTIKDVVTDFLSSAPTMEQIATYRLPDELQARAQHLLDINRAGTLGGDEQAEMEEFRQIDHLLTLVKAKAKIKLKDQE